MSLELDDQAKSECDAIIAEIYAAFADVTRANGISWSECYALDMYEPEDVCEAARRSDTDKHWKELITQSQWQPFPGIGGFAFIDAEGFLYYLPPTMIRFLDGDITEWYPGHLLGVIARFMEPHLLSLWTHAQLRCVARFISFMARHDPEVCLFPDEHNPWVEAIERRWHAYLAE